MTLINPKPDEERRRKGNHTSPRINTSLEHERKIPPRNRRKSDPAMDYTAPKGSMPLPGGFASVDLQVGSAFQKLKTVIHAYGLKINT